MLTKETQMQAFRRMLDADGVAWWDASDEVVGIERTHGTMLGGARAVRFSVVCGLGTYGGSEGLLEARVGNREPEGGMTALEAYEWIRRRSEWMAT